MQWLGGLHWIHERIFWPGVFAFLMGNGFSVVCSYYEPFASPLMTHALGWGDLGFETGILSAGLIYWVQARGRVNTAATA